MQAGKLRNRITILRKTEGAPNASGEPSIVWASLGTFYCSGRLTPRTAETAAMGQRVGEVEFKIEMRRIPNIDFRVADGVVDGEWDGSSTPAIDILGIHPLYAHGEFGAHVGNALMCREHVD